MSRDFHPRDARGDDAPRLVGVVHNLEAMIAGRVVDEDTGPFFVSAAATNASMLLFSGFASRLVQARERGDRLPPTLVVRVAPH